MQTVVKELSTIMLYILLFCQLIVCDRTTFVTRSEKSRIPHTQQQDTLFTIKQYVAVHVD